MSSRHFRGSCEACASAIGALFFVVLVFFRFAAHAGLLRGGGYLLPYRNQFFVTVAAAIRELGLDPEDPDWERIGRDWVRPRDAEARKRLEEKRLVAM